MIWSWQWWQPVSFLCCFHISLPLDALPLLSANAACSFIVRALWHCRFGLIAEQCWLPSWIEFNSLWSATVGRAARLSIYWQDAACRLVIPERQVALAQLYNYHHQRGKVASGKLVWKQHYTDMHLYKKHVGIHTTTITSYWCYWPMLVCTQQLEIYRVCILIMVQNTASHEPATWQWSMLMSHYDKTTQQNSYSISHLLGTVTT